MKHDVFITRSLPLNIRASTKLVAVEVPRPTTQFDTVLVTNTSKSVAFFGYVGAGFHVNECPPTWPVLAGASRIFTHAYNGAYVVVKLQAGVGDVFVEFGDGTDH